MVLLNPLKITLPFSGKTQILQLLDVKVLILEDLKTNIFPDHLE